MDWIETQFNMLADLYGMPAVVGFSLCAAIIIFAMAGLGVRRVRGSGTRGQALGIMKQRGADTIQDARPDGIANGAADAAVQVATTSEPATSSAIAPPPPRPVRVIQDEIDTVRAGGNEQELAALYLELGQSAQFVEDHSAAGNYLREAVILATTHGLKDVHATARLELGGLAKAAGDLTTACEHWQIARGLFHELGAKSDMKQTDDRMLRNGCPTDWVLTDF